MPNSAQQTSPTAPIYTERLLPSFWIWLVVAGIAASCVLVFVPISLQAGIIAAIVAAIIMTVLLLLSTPVIEVTPTTLRVGRAQIERRFVGDVEAFTGDEATAERGTRLNGIAYLCIRGWISPVVRIEITDPADRTPYWLTSTRRPEQLAAALRTPLGD